MIGAIRVKRERSDSLPPHEQSNQNIKVEKAVKGVDLSSSSVPSKKPKLRFAHWTREVQMPDRDSQSLPPEQIVIHSSSLEPPSMPTLKAEAIDPPPPTPKIVDIRELSHLDYQRALQLESEKRIEDAIAVLKIADERLKPLWSGLIFSKLCLLLIQVYEHDEAAKLLQHSERAILGTTNRARFFVDVALAFHKCRKKDLMIDYLRKARILQFDDDTLLRRRICGTLPHELLERNQKGDREESIDCLSELKKLYPPEAMQLRKLATSFLKRKAYPEAIQCLREASALPIDANNKGQVLYELAKIYKKRNLRPDIAEARKILKEADKLLITDRELSNKIGDAYSEL